MPRMRRRVRTGSARTGDPGRRPPERLPLARPGGTIAPTPSREASMADPVRILVVGVGNMGQSHAKAYHKIDGFEVAGLMSRTIRQSPGQAGAGAARLSGVRRLRAGAARDPARRGLDQHLPEHARRVRASGPWTRAATSSWRSRSRPRSRTRRRWSPRPRRPAASSCSATSCGCTRPGPSWSRSAARSASRW